MLHFTLPEVDLIGLAVVGILFYRLLRSDACGLTMWSYTVRFRT